MIRVGDVVFCQVFPSRRYYGHIVRKIEPGLYRGEPEYFIGNIQGHINGSCFRENIFGVLVMVAKCVDAQYLRRPHPQHNYERVEEMVRVGCWSQQKQAEDICEPWKVLILEALD